MKFKVIEYIYYNQFNVFKIFELSEQSEIMYMAMLMSPKLSVTDEEIITQGDEAQVMFIIITGKVTVYLNERIVDHNYNIIFNTLKAKRKFLSNIKPKK